MSVLTLALLFAPPESYPKHPDATRHPGVAEGTLDGPHELRSQVFPGTVRNYWVWVPAGFQEKTADRPAALLVCQDGLGRAKNWNLPDVIDNLVADGSMPYTLGVFVEHGKVPPGPNAPEDAQPRFNRSFEYDSVGDRYATFLVDELLPAVRTKYAFSDDPNDRLILGSSSGAICAFTAAWERPDQFRRVFSSVGTFVGLRGGDSYPTLIRKVEPKPLRLFLQDGSNDLDIYAGGWWTANLEMLAALEWAGYQVNHVWGEGGHNGKHSAAILPDALRWLWKEEPRAGTKETRMNLLLPGEDWQTVSEDHAFAEAPSLHPDGSFWFCDGGTGDVFRVQGDDVEKVLVDAPNAGMEFDGDGVLYATQPRLKKVVKFEMKDGRPTGETTVLLDSSCNDLCYVQGGLYVTDPKNKTVWRVPLDGSKPFKAAGQPQGMNGLVSTPDGTFVWVADSRRRHLWNYRVGDGGALRAGQEYGYVHSPDDGPTRSDGLAVDTDGNVYAGTAMGVQVLDPLGRVNHILPMPNREGVTSVLLAGPDRNVLYACTRSTVYRRTVNKRGPANWDATAATPKPGL